jgi:thioredoxin 1
VNLIKTMKTPIRILIVAAVAVAVVGAVALKKSRTAAGSQSEAVVTAGLPRLVDLGADRCIPCKMMAPVLEELKKEYVGKLNVQFIDVWKNPDAGKPYGIEVIPTQIFFDAEGKELFRHVGFFAKADILAKWKELGVNLNSEGQTPTAEGAQKPEGTSPQPSPQGGAGGAKS